MRTAELLATLHAVDRPSGEETVALDAWVEVLARKAEVARVLRAGYGRDLRPTDRSGAPLDAYAYLAALLADRALTRSDLGALSTLLKIGDVIDHALANDPDASGSLSPGAALAAHTAVEAELALVADVAERATHLPDGHPADGRRNDPLPEIATAAARTLPHSPQVLDGVALVAADTGRARAYLDLLVADGLVPQRAVVLDVPGASPSPTLPHPTLLFDNVTPLPRALERAGVPTLRVAADRLDAREVVDAVAGLAQPIIVFAGPAGGILTEAFFRLPEKSYLHVHPGRLPGYRGSTPMYYSLLAEGRLTATALFLDERVDTGRIVAERDFPPPADRRSIDLEFDPWMRAVLLRAVLREHAAGIPLVGRPQADAPARTYFVIHPVLRHVALLGRAPSRGHT